MKRFFWIFSLMWMLWVFADWVDKDETGVLIGFIVVLWICSIFIAKSFQEKADQDEEKKLNAELKKLQIQKEREELAELKKKRNLLK